MSKTNCLKSPKLYLKYAPLIPSLSYAQFEYKAIAFRKLNEHLESQHTFLSLLIEYKNGI